jgi:hypothetical protein
MSAADPRFGTQPRDDPSGLFTGGSSVATVPEPPAPAAAALPVIHHGPRESAPGADHTVALYVEHYFPQAGRRTR